MYDETIDIGILEGQVIKSVEGLSDDNVYITTENGDCFQIYHSQDCCESVSIFDTIGDVKDIIGSKVVSAVEHYTEQDDVDSEEYYDNSHTWTIYEITTEKGKFVIRWLGRSNGYYSETPYFMRTHARI
jgi:hypothetical protein